MANTNVSFIWEIVFWGAGIILMLLPGKFAKFSAIPCFILEFPLISSKQQYTIEVNGGLSQAALSLPVVINGDLAYFFLMFTYLAILNFFDEIDRDYFGRKRKKQKQ